MSIESPPPTTPGKSAAYRARELAVKGDELYEKGDCAEAFSCFEESVRLQPAQSVYHYRLASAAWKLCKPPLVEKHYLEAIRLDPTHSEPHTVLAQFLLQNGHLDRALYHSEQALKLTPEDADTAITRAAILTAADQPQEAWKLLEPLIASGSAVWHLATAYARIAVKIGHESQACALLERAAGEVGVSDWEKATMHFAAASLLDSMGRYEEAFFHAQLANRLAGRKFDPKFYTNWASAQIQYFSARRMRSLPRAMQSSARPVLIVGMPRSGTTLVEQILASHPSVFGAGELRSLDRIANSLGSPNWAPGTTYPQCLDLLSIRAVNELAAGYVKDIDAMNGTAAHVTDKMPHNFEFLWLAEVLMPDCRVIHCIRDPRDTCLSCYLMDFHEGNAFSYDLPGLASYYRDYRRLMEHWKQVLKLPILEVRYEEVVADLPAQARRMVEFLNLPWDDRCLEFHANARPIATASRQQVRKPIYTSSIGRWKYYEKHIPALMALGEYQDSHGSIHEPGHGNPSTA